MISKYEQSVKHIFLVQYYIMQFINILLYRITAHDQTKLIEPERSEYEKLSKDLIGIEFGTSEYNTVLEKHKDAIAHHHLHNSHHPEYYLDGIEGMDLFDLLEMIADIKAVCKEKDKAIDLEYHKNKYGISDQLLKIIKNTIQRI